MHIIKVKKKCINFTVKKIKLKRNIYNSNCVCHEKIINSSCERASAFSFLKPFIIYDLINLNTVVRSNYVFAVISTSLSFKD